MSGGRSDENSSHGVCIYTTRATQKRRERDATLSPISRVQAWDFCTNQNVIPWYAFPRCFTSTFVHCLVCFRSTSTSVCFYCFFSVPPPSSHWRWGELNLAHHIIARKRLLSQEISGGLNRRKQEGDTANKTLYVPYGTKKRNERTPKLLEVSLLGCSVSKGMRGQWSNDQGKQQMSTPPPPPPSCQASKMGKRYQHCFPGSPEVTNSRHTGQTIDSLSMI